MPPVYERQLDSDTRWALSEGSRHFEEKSAVHMALREISRQLDAHGIPYAIVGGMAMFLHGYRRFTEDVDVLVTKDGLKQAHDNLVGRGYIPAFEGSKNLRDTIHGVRVEFLITGGFPGDGKPKPVSFPNPDDSFIDKEGLRVVPLPKLIELKLASGLSNAARVKDLGDVQELIRHLNLQSSFADELDPSVRDKYLELWSALQQEPHDP